MSAKRATSAGLFFSFLFLTLYFCSFFFFPFILFLHLASLFYRFSSFHLPFFSSPLFPFFLSFFSSFSFFIFKGLFIFYKRSFKIFVLVNNPCTPKQLAKLQIYSHVAMICKFNSVFLIYFVIILNITQTFSNFAEWNLLRKEIFKWRVKSEERRIQWLRLFVADAFFWRFFRPFWALLMLFMAFSAFKLFALVAALCFLAFAVTVNFLNDAFEGKSQQ